MSSEGFSVRLDPGHRSFLHNDRLRGRRRSSGEGEAGRLDRDVNPSEGSRRSTTLSPFVQKATLERPLSCRVTVPLSVTHTAPLPGDPTVTIGVPFRVVEPQEGHSRGNTEECCQGRNMSTPLTPGLFPLLNRFHVVRGRHSFGVWDTSTGPCRRGNTVVLLEPPLSPHSPEWWGC